MPRKPRVVDPSGTPAPARSRAKKTTVDRSGAPYEPGCKSFAVPTRRAYDQRGALIPQAIPAGVAEAGATDGRNPSTLRQPLFAADWPEEAGEPPKGLWCEMPPEAQVDARRVLDALPARPWYAGPDGVYAATGEYVADTGVGGDALARRLAQLPCLLHEALAEIEATARTVCAGVESVLEVRQDAHEKAITTAVDEARVTAWDGGWTGGYEQCTTRMTDAVGDTAEVERSALDARATQLRDSLDTLQHLLAGVGGGGGGGGGVGAGARRRPLRGCRFRGWCPAGARWWGVPRPPMVPGWQRRGRAAGRAYVALGTAHEVALGRIGFGVDDFLLAARDALGAVENAVANVGKEAPVPSKPDVDD